MARTSRVWTRWVWFPSLICAVLLTGCPPAGGPVEEPQNGDNGSAREPEPNHEVEPGPEPEGVHIRRDIYDLDQNDPEMVAALETAIAAMQALPASNQTSWIYQANIHGIPEQGNMSGQICQVTTGVSDPVSWETCQHGQYFFLSWHRMYLYYFERILRHYSGRDDFALPYWDYEKPGQLALPPPFRNPDSPLFVAQRAPGINQGTTQLSSTDVDPTQALMRIPFIGTMSASTLSFGGAEVPAPDHSGGWPGQLEVRPHNVVHTSLGGNVGWMSWPQCAARDPIFWLHHANIDRLWQVWLNVGGGRANPVGDSEWLNTVFTFFDIETDGTPKEVTMTAVDILNTVSQLDYKYAGVPAQEAVTPEAAPPEVAPPASPEAAEEAPEMLASHEKVEELTDERARVALTLPEAETELLRDDKRLIVVVKNVRQVRVGAYYRVFLNLPADAEADPEGPYYVGVISLFGTGHGVHSPHASNFAFDITANVRQLQEQNLWTGDVSLSFERANPQPSPQGEDGPFMTFDAVVLQRQ